MPFAPRTPVDLALKERIRVAYHVEGASIPEIEKLAGVTRGTLYRWFHGWGWPLRRQRREGPRRPAPGFRPGGYVDPAFEPPRWRKGPRDSLKRRLQRLVEHRIGLLELEALAGTAVDPIANARAIELNARTLLTMEKLGETSEPCSCHDERPPRPLTQLRDELYGHLMRISQESREEDEPQPDDDGEKRALDAPVHDGP